jgi:hypothetical protein
VKLAFGIVAILIGLWFLFGIFRGLQPRYNLITRHIQRAHNIGDIVNGILLFVMFCGTGVLLLIDHNLWWILLPVCVISIILWSRFCAMIMWREFEERLMKRGDEVGNSLRKGDKHG